jgi:hypothetical protein
MSGIPFPLGYNATTPEVHLSSSTLIAAVDDKLYRAITVDQGA